MTRFFENETEQEKVILVAVYEKGKFQDEESLRELEELTKTAGAVCVGTVTQNLEAENPVTYIGTGKLDELQTMLVAYGATGIVCDTELTPVQMKNLSQRLDTKIMDRTMVILDIFASRAKTREGKIQVELAQLKYNATMLVGLRSSLSRLGGGIGTRGPGEKKLEMDRRLIREQISKLKRDLEQVKRHRATQRKQRDVGNSPVVCIVGYTNAGKSTLLNHLTKAEVLEENKLFATLDPTTRALKMTTGQTVLLTDTVGFISRLPHHLIQAFRSTLEEAKYCDVILHVVDASNPEMDRQMYAVYDTLSRLDIGNKPIITVFNKIDRLERVPVLKDLRADATVLISAKEEIGLENLQDTIGVVLRQQQIYLEKVIPYQDAAVLSDIRKYGQLLSEEYREDGIHIRAYVRKQEDI